MEIRDDIVIFAYKLYQCDIITLEEYNQVIKNVIYDSFIDIERLIEE